ncbi:hypothetical protein DRN73_09260 [Candidatus Pacearchaeota archaeon]|nr:MAG: hypothetical protein DRN73_09260 [Candidatus Pacearchaeota archaeon]
MYLVLLLVFMFKSIHQIEGEYYKELYRDSFEIWEIQTKALKGRLKFPKKYMPKGMIKNFYGFLPYWVDTTWYAYFHYELLTHLAYFAVEIDPNNGSLGAIPYPSKFSLIKRICNKRGVKVHMTFTIFGSSSVSTFLNNSSARQNAINNIKQFVSDYDLDGVNIDFEFVLSSVRDSFNKFINDLAYELWNHPDGRKELYICTPAVPEWYPGYDIEYLSEHSDGLFIMAYDYYWSGSSVAGPVSPSVPSSFWGPYSVAKTIESYKSEGVSGEKIILGQPYYGYKWPTSSGNIGSSTTGSGSAIIYYYAFQEAQTYGRLWDNYSLTPWYKYYTTQWYQTWYDDSVSLEIKFGMVIDSNLQGGGCWALGYDKNYPHLWNVIKKVFWKEVPQRHFVVEVNTAGLNIREGPGVQYPVMTYAVQGTKLVAFDFKGNWYKVYFPPQLIQGFQDTFKFYYGWMYGGDGVDIKYLKGSTCDSVCRITASILNVRSGPTTDSSIIARVVYGQVYVIDSISSDGLWARIHLPYINGYTKGWIYLGHAQIKENIEDSNNYDAQLISLSYPSEVSSGDTFNVVFQILNSGWGNIDELVYLHKIGSSSCFYYSPYWYDSLNAFTYGFHALPNQMAVLTSIFKAPEVFDTQVITEKFILKRKNQYFGDTISLTIKILPTSIEENKRKRLGKSSFRVISPIFGNELIFEFNFDNFKDVQIEIYDISGRRIYFRRFRIKRGRLVVKDFDKKGIYFYKAKFSGKVLKGKIVKIK